MHLRVGADGIGERIGLAAGLVPAPLVLTTFGPGYGRTCVAATRLGVFDALGDAWLTAPELAARIACDPVGTEVLCRALVGFELLAKRDDHFGNRGDAGRWLRKDGDRSLRDAVLFLGHCHSMLVDLEDAVRTGVVTRLHEREHPPEFWDAYLRGLASFARIAGREIAFRARLPKSTRRLLDVGGGHGLYPVSLLARCPELHAEVLDLPAACRVGRAIVGEAGHADRVTFREGDFRRDPFGESFDAVLLFNVLHNATREEGIALVRRAHDALAPGGTLLIWDAKHGGDRIDANAGWNELFFFLISGARAWPETTMQGWCTDSGFASVAASHLLIAPTVLIRARKG